MWHHGLSPLIISHYPVKSGSHRPHRKGDTVFLICHATSCGPRGQKVMWHYGWVHLILSHDCAGPMSVFVGNI